MSAPPTGSRGPAVELRGLSVRQGGHTLLEPVDLTITEGEHVLVVGASGSGKTTILRAVAGLVTPSAGEVRLFGAEASRAGKLTLAPEDRGVGMLFQGGALWPHMSVEKTLRFAARRSGGADAARIAELLALVRLEGMEKRMPATLSGGERQRLALARAMASRPRLVLLDEPLGPLDAELRTELLERLADLHRGQGWTTLHVTHDPDEARIHADRIVRLRDGRLVEVEEARAEA